jgi:hypothetical protein
VLFVCEETLVVHQTAFLLLPPFDLDIGPSREVLFGYLLPLRLDSLHLDQILDPGFLGVGSLIEICVLPEAHAGFIVEFGYRFELVEHLIGFQLRDILAFLFFAELEKLIELIKKFLSNVVELILLDLIYKRSTCYISALVSFSKRCFSNLKGCEGINSSDRFYFVWFHLRSWECSSKWRLCSILMRFLDRFCSLQQRSIGRRSRTFARRLRIL